MTIFIPEFYWLEKILGHKLHSQTLNTSNIGLKFWSNSEVNVTKMNKQQIFARSMKKSSFPISMLITSFLGG